MTNYVIGTAEVARALKMPRSTVTFKARRGELPVLQKLPGQLGAYLFDRAQIAKMAGGLEDA